MQRAGRGRARTIWWWPWLLALLAFGLRVWAPGPVTETYDERLWLARSDQFVDAVKTRHFDRATASLTGQTATMPGVTTMLAGASGRAGAKVAHRLGLVDPVEGPSVLSATVLRSSRAVVALWCSLALAVFVLMAARLTGRRAALIAGVLLATDPYLAGHSDLLHTDAMVTMFSAVAVVAAMAAVWSRRPAPAPAPDAVRAADPVPAGPHDADPWLVVVSGAAGALALLTKLNALPVVAAPLLLVFVIEAIRRFRRDGVRRRLGQNLWALIRPVLIWCGVVVAVALALWPALWTDPLEQFRLLRKSAEIADQAGAVQPNLVILSLVFRSTPWMLVGTVLAVLAAVGALVHPGRLWPARRVLVVLLLGPLPYLLLLNSSTRVFDRYVLPVWPSAALLIGIALSAATRAAPRLPRRAELAVGAVGFLALASVVLVQAPYGTAWVNPLAGGAPNAKQHILLGWGEGVERLGQTLARREAGHCDTVRVAIRYPLRIAVPCGVIVQPDGRRRIPDVDYVIREILHTQRRSLPSFDESIAHGGRLVQRVKIDRVSYAELWKVPRQP